MWLGGAALAGATLVGINPTRRGEELARDIRHTDCQLIVTEPSHRPLLDGLDLGAGRRPGARRRVRRLRDGRGRAPGRARRRARGRRRHAVPAALHLGHHRAPRRRASARRAAWPGPGSACPPASASAPDDCAYLAMPLFHSNALFAGWSPAVVGGMTMALRRKFSASGLIEDVRDFGVTYFNYVGKPLAYVLATPGAARRRRQPAEGRLRQRGRRARRPALRRALRRHRRRQLRLHRGRGRGHP